MASTSARWIRAAWLGAFSHGKPHDIMVGLDGDSIVIWRIESNEHIRISRKDWAKLFWAVKRQIEETEHDTEDDAPAARGVTE